MNKREKHELAKRVAHYRSLEEERRIYKYKSVICSAESIVRVLNTFEGGSIDGPSALTNFVSLARELRKSFK